MTGVLCFSPVCLLFFPVVLRLTLLSQQVWRDLLILSAESPALFETHPGAVRHTVESACAFLFLIKELKSFPRRWMLMVMQFGDRSHWCFCSDDHKVSGPIWPCYQGWNYGSIWPFSFLLMRLRSCKLKVFIWSLPFYVNHSAYTAIVLYISVFCLQYTHIATVYCHTVLKKHPIVLQMPIFTNNCFK